MAEAIAIQRYGIHGDAFRNITDPMTSRAPASLARKQSGLMRRAHAQETIRCTRPSLQMRNFLRPAKPHNPLEKSLVLTESFWTRAFVSVHQDAVLGGLLLRAGWKHMPAAALACACIIDGGVAAALSPPDIPDDPCTPKKMAIAQEVGVVLGVRVRVWLRVNTMRDAPGVQW